MADTAPMHRRDVVDRDRRVGDDRRVDAVVRGELRVQDGVVVARDRRRERRRAGRVAGRARVLRGRRERPVRRERIVLGIGRGAGEVRRRALVAGVGTAGVRGRRSVDVDGGGPVGDAAVVVARA